WEDSVPQIFRRVNSPDLNWPVDDDGHFDTGHRALLSSIGQEYEVPLDLLAKMLKEERRAHGMARRAGIQKALSQVLEQEWRSEEEILAPDDSELWQLR